MSKRTARAGNGMVTKGRDAAAEAEKGEGTVRRKEEETGTETMIMIEVEPMGVIVSVTDNGGN